jgi:hypothetical protein
MDYHVSGVNERFLPCFYWYDQEYEGTIAA